MTSSIKACLGWTLVIVVLSVVIGIAKWGKGNPTTFSAQASLLVETPKRTPPSSPAPLPFGTYVAILQSVDFTQYVDETFTAEERDLIRRGSDPLKPQPSVYGHAVSPEHLTMRADKASGKIFIKVRSAVPEAAALVANRWALRLIDYSIDRMGPPKKPPANPGVAIITIGGGMQTTNICIFDPAYIPKRPDNAWW